MKQPLIAFTLGLTIALTPAIAPAQTLSPSEPRSVSGAELTYLTPTTGTLSSGYGWRWGRLHQGIDISAPIGTPIYAAAAGVVEFVGTRRGYGLVIEIRHPDGSLTRYAHNSQNLATIGTQVEQGQAIAQVGATGYVTGPHLHFEIHRPGQGAVNPTLYLQTAISLRYLSGSAQN